MAKTEGVEPLAIKAQANDLRFDSLVSFAYTADIINRFLDIELFKYGGKRTYFNILHSLVINDGIMTPTELSRKVFRSKHAITRAIDSLERRGLVIREGIGSDRRTRRVTITKKGLDAVNQAMPYRQDASKRCMSCLEEQQVEGALQPPRRLRNHVLGLIR